MKNILLFILFVCLSNIIQAQDTLSMRSGENKYMIKSNPTLYKPFGINIYILGPTMVSSLSVDYSLTSSLNVEAGVGLIGTFGGLKYYFDGANKDKNWTPYLGVYLARDMVGSIWNGGGFKNSIYTPLGIQFQKKKGRTFGAEIAYTSLGAFHVWGALKIGYRFIK